MGTRGKVAMELWGLEDFESELRGAQLHKDGGDILPGGQGEPC